MNNQKIFLQRYKTRTDVNLWTKPRIQFDESGQTLEKPFSSYQTALLEQTKMNKTLNTNYFSKYQKPYLKRNNTNKKYYF